MRGWTWIVAALTSLGLSGGCGDDGSGGQTSEATESGSSSSGSTTGTSQTTTSTTQTTETTTTVTSAGPTTGDPSTGGTGTTGDPGQPVAVVVGYGARRASSADGETWENFAEVNASGGDDNDLLRGVAWGGGAFVAVGGADNGLSFSSVDGGVTWDNENRTVRAFISDAAYLDGEFVAVGGNGLRVRSADLGANWTDDAGFEMAHFRAVAANDTVAVAVGHTYGGAGFWSTSTDGVTWTEPSMGGTSFRDIAWGDDIFVAVGDGARISSSSDGETWDDASVMAAGNLLTVAFVDGTFYVADLGQYWVSDDGTQWTAMTSDTARPLVGWFGGAYFSTDVDASIDRSTDLSQWTNVFTMPGGGFTAMAVGFVEMQ